MGRATVRLLDCHHPDFPIGIRSMIRPAERLFVCGALPPEPGIAIVGTRAADDDALAYARELAFRLASSGIPIWSGGATGVDAAAHRGALEAQGHTVVVMGSGFDHPYPSANRDLFDRVLDAGGGWVSTLPPQQRATRWSFLQRNEVLAAITKGVVIVQAGLRSGARSTTAAARRMGRQVWAVPASPWDPRSRGCFEELRLGAGALGSPDDVITACGKRPILKRVVPDVPVDGLPADLTNMERTVANALRRATLHPDDICRVTKLEAKQVSAALLTLSLRHVLVEGSDGRFRITNR
jgi:DNA processing protein